MINMKIENIYKLKAFLFQQCERSRQYSNFYDEIEGSFMLFKTEDIEELVDLIKYIAEDEKHEQYEISIKQ